MPVDFPSHNPAFLRAFGESYTLVRSEDLLDDTPVSEPFTAVNVDLSPDYDADIYLLLWVDEADFTDKPSKGDEVTTDTTVYKIVDSKPDREGGRNLLCRKDRDA